MDSSINKILKKNDLIDILASSKINTPRAYTQRKTKRDI